MRNKLYILLLVLLYCSRVFAQQNDIYTSYGVDDGLSQSSVWSIVQDKQGFLWVGTSDGICRFDGYKFTVYRGGGGNSNTITGGTYIKFYIDSNSELWTISQNGVCHYDRIKDRFIEVFSHRKYYSGDYNCIIGEDSQCVYAGMARYGIVKINKRTKETISIANNVVSGISSWLNGALNKGDVWVLGSGAGCAVYHMGSGKLEKLPFADVTVVHSFNDSTLIFASYNEVVLLNKYDNSYKRIPIRLGDKANEHITGILPLSAKEVMLVSQSGVFYIDAVRWQVKRHVQSFARGEQNTFSYVQCVYKDRSGNIWLGTNGDGLRKLTAPNKHFKYYLSNNPKSSLVRALYADRQHLYIGYYAAGMSVYSRDSGFVRSEVINAASHNSNSVFGITAVDTANLLLRIDAKQSILSYSLKEKRQKDLSAAFVNILKDPQTFSSHPFFLRDSNTIYINVGGHSVFSFDATSLTDIKPRVIVDIKGETINCGYIDSKGTLWFGTMNCLYYMEGDKCQKCPLPELVHIKSINQDKSGRMWVGSVKGIYIIDSNRKLVQHYSERNALSSQFIYGILRDDAGNMWFSHNKGLSVYRAASGTFRHYTKDDGLQSNEFNTGAYFKAADGELFFGGIAGTNSFYPQEIRDNPHAPVTVITNIKLFDTPLKTDSAYWNIRSLRFSYLQNSLSFEFAALEYTNPKSNQYAYMMEGVDKDWIIVGDERVARYSALPPGNYIFKVKAANNDGLWQEQPTTISIAIIPPFWQQWWFLILGGLILIVCLSVIITWIQRIRHRREIRALELRQKIQLERERISRDLHDTVGTQLSLISNNIEWVAHPLKEISDNEKAEKLQFVNDTARDIIGTLRETIWALNKQQITLEEFSDKLKAFVQKQLSIYPEINLNFNEQIDQNIVLGPSEALDMFRICQEAIANALKYANAGVIDITIAGAEGKYRLTIDDDGKGFDINSVDPAIQNGLENMKFRAQDAGSILEIRSEKGKGTHITITKK